MEEPSVLDYVKDRLAFWRPPRLFLPEIEEEEAILPFDASQNEPAVETVLETTNTEESYLPWLPLAGLFASFFAQIFLEPKYKNPWVGVPLYLLTAVLVVLAYLRKEWLPAEIPPQAEARSSGRYRIEFLIAGLFSGAAAFIFFGSERFNWVNLLLWILALGLTGWSFWEKSERLPLPLGQRLNSLRLWHRWQDLFTPWNLLVLASLGLILFFRFYKLNQVPLEMVSDHAEKLLDVLDVLNGQFNIYFPRNTGREFIQFYLTALVILVFKTGVSFLSLKIGTAIASLLTMPYIYLLGKEVGNRWVGLIAMVMAGTAYWTNMFTRIGLRFALYPLFVAPCLYYLIRGLRTSRRNDFIFSGIALGLGLHGYTAFRIVPFLVVIAVVLYLLHRQSRGARKETVIDLAVLVMISLVVFIPLFRYAVAHPDLFAYRAFSRLTDWEQPLPGSAVNIFFQNLWNASTMFFWSDGIIWAHSVPNRPALDFISAALFFCGIVLLVVRYVHRRNWLDLYLLISVPVLMAPSILSLAFPDENPSLNRTAGAIIPVFIIAAIALDGLFTAFRKALPGKTGYALSGLLGASLLVMTCGQNYSLVFDQYNQIYTASTWNTTEMGSMIKGFSQSIGTSDSAWVVGYPYWVDTRLVGINAGYPAKDYAIWPEQIADTVEVAGAKLFIVNPQDTTAIAALKTFYPDGQITEYQSQVAGKNFLIDLIIPETDPSATPG